MSVDPVHGAMDIFYEFLLRKIIPWISKITRISEFCKNTPELFHNNILVPVILHLGPYLAFYNYHWVILLINLLILITYLIY
jgi:tyrosine-protein phosphatase YwqE